MELWPKIRRRIGRGWTGLKAKLHGETHALATLQSLPRATRSPALPYWMPPAAAAVVVAVEEEGSERARESEGRTDWQRLKRTNRSVDQGSTCRIYTKAYSALDSSNGFIRRPSSPSSSSRLLPTAFVSRQHVLRCRLYRPRHRRLSDVQGLQAARCQASRPRTPPCIPTI